MSVVGLHTSTRAGKQASTMTEATHLDHHHQVTVQGIFRHPVGHNIEWHDVLSLLDKVGNIVEEGTAASR